MEGIILAPLDALEASLNALVTSLTTTSSFASAPSATKDLLSADDALNSALATLKQHQDNYARLLTLKDEANRLQEQIRSIVRTCGQLRTEVGEINGSILEESDSDDEDSSAKGVDYKTLLAFAARIGKHNAVAAREAEQDSMKRRIEAQKREQDARPQMNGNSAEANGARDTVKMPEESQNDLNFLNSQVAAERAVKGMAFPAAEILRNGALGQLQLAREQGGEDAVDIEVERWIREADGTKGNVANVAGEESSSSTTAAPEARVAQTAGPRQRAAPQEQAAAPKRLKLDMWDEDSDDDD